MSFARPEQKSIVTVKNLSKDYFRPGGAPFTVLEDINLEVYDNEFLAILGTSGSGKSTLLRSMAGLIPIDRGNVAYAPLPPNNKKRLSFVFQNFALLPWLTVKQNIEVGIRDLPPAERSERVDAFLKIVGLSGFDDAYPRDLSGGMKQRVGICRAIIADPMVLFMDEPFGALDPLTGELLRNEIERIWQQRERKIRAIILVTHSIEEAVQLADRIVILSTNPGRVFRTIEIKMPRPRHQKDAEYQRVLRFVEQTFAELHLSRSDVLDEDTTIITGETTQNRHPIAPLANVNLVVIEGLVVHLSDYKGAVSLFELSDVMAQSVNELMPVVVAAELLGFIETPGVNVVLTPLGRTLAATQDGVIRQNLLRSACLDHPLVKHFYESAKASEDGIDRKFVLDELSALLPFENAETQFDALVNWGVATEIFEYDHDRETLSAHNPD